MANETSQVAPMPGESSEALQIPPALNEKVVNDLVDIINLLMSAKDAMSDDMVTRIARTASESTALLDRLIRNEGVARLLQVLDRPECQYLLISLADAIARTSSELATARPARGSIACMWRLAREPGTQEGLRAFSLLGKYWSDALRDLHRREG